MLHKKTPVGLIRVSEYEEKEFDLLSDEKLLTKAIKQENHFAIDPDLFAAIEKRNLYSKLQKMVNPNMGSNYRM